MNSQAFTTNSRTHFVLLAALFLLLSILTPTARAAIPTADSRSMSLLDSPTLSGSCASPAFFGRPGPFTAGTNPTSIAVADFNRDGKADLAVANYDSGDISILLGSGTGSFSARRNFSVGSQPHDIAVGDWNGDGTPDLAVANEWSNNVTILLNGCNPLYLPLMWR